jgi:DNA primase
MDLVEEVKKRLDIVEIASGYTQLTKAGRTYRGLCPLHSEKHGSFFVYPEDGSWHCFGACNTGGDIFSLVMKKEGLSFGEALKMLAEKAGIEVPQKTTGREDDLEPIYQINLKAAYYFNNLLLKSSRAEKARQFLKERGVAEETIERFVLGYSLPDWEDLKDFLEVQGFSEELIILSGLAIRSDTGRSYDRFRDRLIFPIRDIKGRVAGFGGRALDDTMPKYLNSGETAVFNKGKLVYGIDLAREAIRKEDRAVIVEGYMDTIIAHQYGFSNTVASMGTAVTEDQIYQLKKLTQNIILALDSDQAGEEAMIRCTSYENVLSNEIKVIQLPQGEDPDDVIREGRWTEFLSQARPLLEYAFEKLSNGLDLNTAQGKSGVTRRLIPVISEVRDPIKQAHYLAKLAKLAGVSENRLAVLLKKEHTSDKTKEVPVAELFESPIEEYCLSLLIHKPDLRGETGELVPEFFENSQNREVFLTIMRESNMEKAIEKLDPSLREHFDRLANRFIPTESASARLADCILRLKERHLRNLITRREAALESAKSLPEEIDARLSWELGEVFKSREKEIKNDKRL